MLVLAYEYIHTVRRRKSTKSPRSHPKICYYSAYKCLDGIISICRDHNYFWAYDRGAAECFWYASQHLQSGAVRLPRKQKQHGKRTSLQHRRTQVCVSAESPGHRELSTRGRSKQAAAAPPTTTTTPPGTSQQFLCLSLSMLVDIPVAKEFFSMLFGELYNCSFQNTS